MGLCSMAPMFMLSYIAVASAPSGNGAPVYKKYPQPAKLQKRVTFVTFERLGRKGDGAYLVSKMTDNI
jgi:hypothetical protein